jgi:hypothetical protein
MTDDAVCPVNLDAAGTGRRRLLGILSGVGGAALAAYAVTQRLGLVWRLPAIALMSFGVLCLLQARAKVCVIRAARRQNEVEGRGVGIEDPALAAALSRRGVRITLFWLGATVVLGALVLLA